MKGSACSKVLILALVTIALVCPPDQCEATKCYTYEEPIEEKPRGDCSDEGYRNARECILVFTLTTPKLTDLFV